MMPVVPGALTRLLRRALPPRAIARFPASGCRYRPIAGGTAAASKEEEEILAGPSSTSTASGEEPHGEREALVPSGARVYRRDRAEHQRIFEWGVGNKFRMQDRNRFMPVHKPHPMERMVRDDYYDSDNPNIMWEELNEAWEVYWYANNKLNAKPFPVKKFGIERAKREAFAFFAELESTGRLQTRPRREAPGPGIFYDERLQDWVCFFWRGGRPHSRCYSAQKYGFDGARSLAVAKQRDPVDGLLHPKNRGGGTPAAVKPPGCH